jgi:hypothetical protein
VAAQVPVAPVVGRTLSATDRLTGEEPVGTVTSSSSRAPGGGVNVDRDTVANVPTSSDPATLGDTDGAVMVEAQAAFRPAEVRTGELVDTPAIAVTPTTALVVLPNVHVVADGSEDPTTR